MRLGLTLRKKLFKESVFNNMLGSSPRGYIIVKEAEIRNCNAILSNGRLA